MHILLRALTRRAMPEETLRDGDLVLWHQQGCIVHAAIALSLMGDMHLLHASTNTPCHVPAGAPRAFSGVMLTRAMDEVRNGRATLCTVYRPMEPSDTGALREATKAWYGRKMTPLAPGASVRFHLESLEFARSALRVMGHPEALLADTALRREVGTIECSMARPTVNVPNPLNTEERDETQEEIATLLPTQWSVAQRV